MIQEISLEKFRGIREGRLEHLAPLTILVGRNGSGKSALLDALLIAASPDPADAIGRAVRRRQTSVRGARWLFWKAATEGPASIKAIRGDGEKDEIAVQISISDVGGGNSEIAAVIEGTHQGAAFRGRATTHVAPDNKYSLSPEPGSRYRPPGSPFARFIETRLGAFHASLPELYTAAAEQGRKQLAHEVVKALVGGSTGLEILMDEGKAYLSLGFGDRSVPVEVAGDGTQALVRLALELAIPPGSLALLEEPEVHLHPAGVALSAKAILEAVRRDVQVVLSTHSLELIDALIAEATADDLKKAAVFRTRLDDGHLLTSRFSGEDAAEARLGIEEDLR